MKVSEFIEQLQELPQDKDITIKSINNVFSCLEFEINAYTFGVENGTEEVEITLPQNFSEEE